MAIVRDAATNAGFNQFADFNHTCDASATLLLIACWAGTTDNVTTPPTYNGTGTTAIGKVQVPGDRWVYLFGLANPASGTHAVSWPAGSGAQMSCAISYIGASTTFPDAHVESSGNPSTPSWNLTTVADNCFRVTFV